MKDKQLKNKVMEKITNKEVKMKPKWYFKAQWLGLNAVTWGLLVWGGLMLAWLLFWIELMEPWEWWQFGGLGVEVIGERFPVVILGGAAAAGIGFYLFFRNLGDNYRIKAGKILLMTAIFLAFTTLIWWLLKNMYELEVITGWMGQMIY